MALGRAGGWSDLADALPGDEGRGWVRDAWPVPRALQGEEGSGLGGDPRGGGREGKDDLVQG